MSRFLFFPVLAFFLPLIASAGETAAGTVIEISGVGTFVIVSSLFISWKQMPDIARSSIRKTLCFWRK
ncbi:hypothetical protein [Puniceicoccus vermicola]|uniref:Uncharacterized protein n=1 Tax=Puniceicoccus vermicola TaxID=388746 RepID=A0A7X1B1J4_9BACT|nr:hypothetical protein [Puniceicoccus vermicola]MBC2603916.1 hypothetical protein [Puniceicoccus vermicola]